MIAEEDDPIPPAAEQAAAENGIALLEVTGGTEPLVVALPAFGRSLRLSLVQPGVLAALRGWRPAREPAVLDSLKMIASSLVGEGVLARQQGKAELALRLYRLPLAVTVLLGDDEGLNTVAENLWIAAEMTQNAAVLDLIRSDAAAVLGDPGAAIADGSLLRVDGVRMLADLAGDSRARRELLLRLCRRADRDARNEREIVLRGLYQELSRFRATDDPDARDASFSDASFSEVAAAFADYRVRSLSGDNSPILAGPAMAAFDRVEQEWIALTAADMPSGHERPAACAGLLQAIGHDAAALVYLAGHSVQALSVIERVRARAMVDWMGRAHGAHLSPHIFAVVKAAGGGALNATEVASLADVAGVVSLLGCPILYLFVIGHDVLIMLVKPDSSVEIEVSALPEDTAALAAGAVPERYESALRACGDALLPARIRDAVRAAGRVVLVADEALEDFPFCALLAEDGRFLVEDVVLWQWPSVTAGIMLEQSRAARAVIGKASLLPERGHFVAAVQGFPDRPDSPWARTEAEEVAALLGTAPRLDPDATAAALFAGPARASWGVVHLATSELEAARLCGSDRSDRALNARLVVLSTCQTTAGEVAPTGLADGFLVAGALTVLAASRPLPDPAASELIRQFYDLLGADRPVPEALAEAQRAVLRDPSRRHPRNWAGFRVSGSPGNPLDGTPVDDRWRQFINPWLWGEHGESGAAAADSGGDPPV